MKPINQVERYNRIWKCGDILSPKIWSTWEIIKNFQGKRNLEIGPGNLPKIPIKGGFFIDISQEVIEGLKSHGAKAVVGDASNLPFKSRFFHLVVAMDVLEHIDDDQKAFFEIARVLKSGGFFLISVPLRKELFSEFDIIVGHKRRYEIQELEKILTKNQLKILKYRGPSFYLKKLSNWSDKLGLPHNLYKNENSLDFFHLPRSLVNFFLKAQSFINKKGTPQWQTDIKALADYQEKHILILSQKE